MKFRNRKYACYSLFVTCLLILICCSPNKNKNTKEAESSSLAVIKDKMPVEVLKIDSIISKMPEDSFIQGNHKKFLGSTMAASWEYDYDSLKKELVKISEIEDSTRFTYPQFKANINRYWVT